MKGKDGRSHRLPIHPALGSAAPINTRPMRELMPPKNQQKDVNYFQPVQICDILDALEGEPLKWQLVTHLLMITGARRGEIAGLKWSKFDMEKRRLKVDTALLNSTKIGVYETTTKTSNQRYIPLPDETFALLRCYRVSQMELQLANGDRWVQTDYVFTQSDGSPIRPDTITQWLAKFSTSVPTLADPSSILWQRLGNHIVDWDIVYVELTEQI